MANTFTLIASNTLSSPAASVTFSSIPGTYTDLVLRMSARKSSAVGGIDLGIQFNSDTATNYSRTRVDVNSTTITSDRTSAATSIVVTRGIQSFNSTVPTYNNLEIYLSSYTTSTNKSLSVVNVSEFNSASWAAGLTAGLYSTSSAVTSITLLGNVGGGSFGSGSSFFLYGIKNS